MTTETAAPAKKPKTRKAQPIPHPAPSGPPAAPLRTKVRIDELVLDKTQDRQDRGEITEAAINCMADSFRMSGQLQPIGVNDAGGKPRLIWGHVRHAAAQIVGWEELDALVYKDLSDEQVHELRLTENVQRLELNPIEEAESCAKLLDLAAARLGNELGRPFAVVTGYDKRKAIQEVAARSGKTEKWVTDRAYLARLAPAARELVLAELLPLGHAREIAKVIDPKVQAQIAKAVAATAKWDTPADFDDVRRMCAQHLFTLTTVAWRLDVPFAGKVACDGCPHNSAAQPGLFGNGVGVSASVHESRTSSAGSCRTETDAGICTNAACYLEKTRAAASKLSAASGKAVALIAEASKKDKAKVERTVAGQVTPDGLQTKAVARRIKERIQRTAGRVSPPRQEKVDRKPTDQQLRAQAEEALADALRGRVRKLEPLIAKALHKKPGTFAMLHLLKESKLYQSTQGEGDKAQRVAQSPGFRALIEAMDKPSWEGLLAIEKDCGKNYGLFDEWYDGPSGVVEMVAEVLGVSLDQPAPTLDDFLAKSKKKGGAEA